MLACIPNKTTIKISMDSLFWNRQWSETINAYYHDCCCYYQPSPRVCNLAYCQLVPSPSKLLMSWQEEHPVQNIGAEHWILSNLWGCCKPLSGQTARGKSGRVQSNQHGTVKKIKKWQAIAVWYDSSGLSWKNAHKTVVVILILTIIKMYQLEWC